MIATFPTSSCGWSPLCLQTKIPKTKGVSHSGLAMYIKNYLIKAKEEFWKLKYFTMQKI
jgi:hypothetical protein